MTQEQSVAAANSSRQTREQWDAAAAGWDKHTSDVRKWLRVPTDAMIKMAGIGAGHSVLDVAAGAGDQSLDVAKIVGPNGRVVATDISAGILAHALKNAKHAGHNNVEIHQADIEDLGLNDQRFDAAISRLGLMFCPNPLKGISEIKRVLKPGAHLCAMVFAGPVANPCLRILMSTAMRHAGLAPGDPFRPGGLVSLGKPSLMDDLFEQAGFGAVATTQIDAPFCLPTTKDFLRFIQDAASPILQILSPLTEEAKAAAWADITAQLDEFQTSEGWVGPNTLLLTLGQG